MNLETTFGGFLNTNLTGVFSCQNLIYYNDGLLLLKNRPWRATFEHKKLDSLSPFVLLLWRYWGFSGTTASTTRSAPTQGLSRHSILCPSNDHLQLPLKVESGSDSQRYSVSLGVRVSHTRAKCCLSSVIIQELVFPS